MEYVTLPLPIKSVHYYKTSTLAVEPKLYSSGAVGYGLTSVDLRMIAPNTTVVFDTGLVFSFPSSLYGELVSNGDLALERGIHCITTNIDSDHRGTVKVILRNTSSDPYTPPVGQCIAKLIFREAFRPVLIETEMPFPTDNEPLSVKERTALENTIRELETAALHNRNLIDELLAESMRETTMGGGVIAGGSSSTGGTPVTRKTKKTLDPSGGAISKAPPLPPYQPSEPDWRRNGELLKNKHHDW